MACYGLPWAALLVVLTGYALLLYHFEMALAERIRAALGLHVPSQGPDWFLAGALLLWPILAAVLGILLWRWYRRVWFRRSSRYLAEPPPPQAILPLAEATRPRG